MLAVWRCSGSAPHRSLLVRPRSRPSLELLLLLLALLLLYRSVLLLLLAHHALRPLQPPLRRWPGFVLALPSGSGTAHEPNLALYMHPVIGNIYLPYL